MADLQEIEPLLGQLFTTYNLARNEADAAQIHLSDADWYPNTLAKLYANFPKLCLCLDDLIDAVNALICTNTGIYMYWFCNVDCFRRVVADAGGVTWQSIILAWVSMNKAEMLYTVDFIDQMRQTVWNNPITDKLQANPFA